MSSAHEEFRRTSLARNTRHVIGAGPERALTVPSIIGEFWIVGYLIVFGVREHAWPDRESARVAAT